MRTVAISAAIFSGALFLGAASSFAPDNGATNTNNAISKTTSANVLEKVTKDSGSNPSSPSRPSVELASVTTTTTDGTKHVTVESGDYLSKIARENGTNYQRMFYANTEVSDPDLIYPGQKLRVPKADEQLTPRPLPENAPAEVKAEVQAETSTPAPQASSYVAPQPEYTAPVQQQQSAAPSVAGGSVWDALAQCEAGGNWAINTGNGFYGGLQFTLSSWQAAGGSGYPHQASRDEQIKRGQILQSMQGWGAWPACSAKLGLR